MLPLFNLKAMIDLHLHSSYSDGTWTPKQVLQKAAEFGFKAVSITDHDRVGGIDEAIEAGNSLGIEVIPGIEITAVHRGIETHILGYFIDYKNPGLSAEIRKLDTFRTERVRDMVRLLRNHGVIIDFEDVVECSPSGYLGRPHIAEAMVKSGAILRSREAFTSEYIGNEGKCYIPTSNLTVFEAIDIISEHHGLSVLAHPGFWDRPGEMIPAEDIAVLKKEGLDGIEVKHSRHSRKIEEHFYNLAEKLDLIKTGGSDCHGTFYDPIKMGTVEVPDEWLAIMKDRLAAKLA